MKKCPYCGGEIQDEAIVCRYCFRDLGPTPRSTRSTSRHLMSAIEYVMNWLKVNDPELHRGIVAKRAEAKKKPTPMKISRK